MPKRKPVEAAEPAPVVAEPKKTVRKAAAKPTTTTASSAVHKHHSKKNTDSVSATPAANSPVITQEAIAQLAYSYWEARGFQGGSSEQDWLRAEQELLKLS